ncbi:unnamed protein product, partial [Polarella glacialis]
MDRELPRTVQAIRTAAVVLVPQVPPPAAARGAARPNNIQPASNNDNNQPATNNTQLQLKVMERGSTNNAGSAQWQTSASSYGAFAHSGSGDGDFEVEEVPKDVREDVRTRCVFLLRMVFAKEVKVPYGAKCRALAVLFRIADPEEIAVAYRNPVSELREIWKLYYYMDAFDRLGVPQEFKRFYQCNKAGLARSLWRSHQQDPKAVQVIAALCLDFRLVDDGCFWAAILERLRDLGLWTFLADTLTALHGRLLQELPHEPILSAVLVSLCRAPVDALEEWLRRSPPSEGAPLGGAITWLPLLPQLLRQKPCLASAEALQLARRLLQATQGFAAEGEGQDAMILKLSKAAFGPGLGSASGRPGDESPSAEECRALLGGLAFRVAVAGPSQEQ